MKKRRNKKMKTTKRLISIVLAVLMLAVMAVPFTAGAVGYTLNINGKSGFTATVYKVAAMDPETGEFSSFVDNTGSTAVEAAIKAGYTGANDNTSAALFQAVEGLTAATLDGKSVQTVAFTSTKTETVALSDAGVYYVKWTTQPSGVTKAQSSVFALPYYDNGWVNTVTIADTKTATDTPDATKTFATADAAEKTAKVGDEIGFVLTGSVPGSATLPAKEIKFVDTMTKGLSYKSGLKVYGVSETGSETEITTGFTSSSPAAGDKTFTITFAETQTPALYTAGYKNIKITYTAQLTGDAVDYTTAGNVNTLTYTYKNNSGVESDPIEKTRKVKTFQFKVEKTDTDGNVITDKQAGFTVYTNRQATTAYTNGKITGEIKTTNGIATFQGLEPGDYYVKETSAPEGYALNGHIFAITIGADGTVTGDGVKNDALTLQVKDPKIIVPNTGGEGTMVFTICGIALIAGAAVLFVIYRKRTAK